MELISYTRDFTDKGGLAKLGDSLINLVFSLALSEYLGRPTGGRGFQTHLSPSHLRWLGLGTSYPPRTDKHGKGGDIAEALFAYAWLEKKITIEEAVEILSQNLNDDVTHFTRKKETIGKAFAVLYEEIGKRLGLKD
ncbi:ribonuclease III family protein [Thermococcus peptonophilus]